MKRRNKFLLIVLSLVLSVSMIACGGTTSEEPRGETKSEEIWGTYSTAKVTKNVKDDVPYEKFSASINIQMMKNEKESSQIVITAGSNDIKSYSLKTADLTDEKGNVIPKEDVSVYHQKYVEVLKKTDLLNENYIVGDLVPDMLLPLDIATKYGENTVKAETNQGITVDVKTNSDTVAGVYTATFVLDVDGKKTDIPVSVEVWDIEYEGRRTFMSSFLLYRNSLVAGEYEASKELVDNYIDFFLDYKINTYVIQDKYNLNDFINEAKRLWENDNYNSICIPKGLSGTYTSSSNDAKEIVDYITEIVKISTPEQPYIDALYIYPSYYDEVDAYPAKYSDYERIFSHDGEWDKTLQKALAKVKETEEYQNFDNEFKAYIETAVLNVPAVNPQTTFKDSWVEGHNVTFCPVLDLLDEEGNLQEYQDYADINQNGDLWGYTCMGPTYPHPTFHIDDYNLGTRVTGWMCKKFDLDGYLYWATNIYEAVNLDKYREVDVYETAERAAYCAGDGFLVYPGAYYGSEYPFPTNRLVAWRDTMDDYDMLTVYENLLNEKAEKYGITIDFDDYVNDLYDTLFTGTNYYTDDSIVIKVKEELAKRILALQSEDEIMFKLESGKAVIYSANSFLTINGKKVNGEVANDGYKYEIENTTSKQKTVNVETENNEYVCYIRANSTSVEFTNSSKVAKISEKSSITFEEGKATVNIVSVVRSEDGTIDGATQRFIPFVQFDASVSNGRAISFTMENTGDANLKFTLRAVLEDGSTNIIGTGFLFAGATREYRYDFDARFFTNETLANVKGIRFEFANVNEEGTQLEPNKTFTISNITCEIV